MGVETTSGNDLSTKNKKKDQSRTEVCEFLNIFEKCFHILKTHFDGYDSCYTFTI